MDPTTSGLRNAIIKPGWKSLPLGASMGQSGTEKLLVAVDSVMLLTFFARNIGYTLKKILYSGIR